MKEQLISFDTAKLAKEKGWTTNYLNTLDYYKTDGIKAKLEDLSKNRDYKDFYFHAPTQSLLQKWLREEHRVNVEANWLPNIQTYRPLYTPMDIKPKDLTKKQMVGHMLTYVGLKDFDSYEGALEEGLLQALKRLK